MHTATHCNTLQHTATHCNTLQHTATATHYNTLQLQHTTTHDATIYNDARCIFCYDVSQCAALRYSVLQCVAVSCSILQCAAVCSRYLQRCKVHIPKSQKGVLLQCIAVCCSVLPLSTTMHDGHSQESARLSNFDEPNYCTAVSWVMLFRKAIVQARM